VIVVPSTLRGGGAADDLPLVVTVGRTIY
jgi:hypothetical protein